MLGTVSFTALNTTCITSESASGSAPSLPSSLSPHCTGTRTTASTKYHQRMPGLPRLRSRGAGPGGGQASTQTPVFRLGYLHFCSALWYRRPWVCLSTCSGDLLMCRRVSLQNSWCLRGQFTSKDPDPWFSTRQTDRGGLPRGWGIRILKSSQATAVRSRVGEALIQADCGLSPSPWNTGLTSLAGLCSSTREARRRKPGKVLDSGSVCHPPLRFDYYCQPCALS